MDTTMQELANFIYKNKQSDSVHKRYRAGAAIIRMESEISSYRMYAYKHRGTFAAQYCNQEANYIEGLLRKSLR